MGAGIKTIILAGGLGTRLSEETIRRPKPMVQIGEHPILWHIMNIYAAYSQKDFVVAAGYKSEVIKDFFCNYHIHNSDWEVDLSSGNKKVINTVGPDWKVSVIDTGLHTMTGGRVLRLKDYIGNEPFMLTYGDGVGNINIAKLLEFHKSHNKMATVTAVRPPARFGGLSISDVGEVDNFSEKPQTGEGWINGGFFVFNPEFFDFLDDDKTILERSPLEKVAQENQLMAFKHDGYWQPMDTLREKEQLNKLWSSGEAPWSPKLLP